MCGFHALPGKDVNSKVSQFIPAFNNCRNKEIISKGVEEYPHVSMNERECLLTLTSAICIADPRQACMNALIPAACL